MINTTETNITARIDWLRKIIMREYTPTDDEIELLADLRTFITSEIKNKFARKAYNTVKTYSLKNRIIGTPHHHPNTWEYIKELRAQAHNETLVNERLINGEKHIKNLENHALLEAHLCAMAYLEINDFLRSLINEPSLSNLLQAKIKNFLSISHTKYSHITSHNPREGSTLQVIQGGKR
ncbi:hypothetical protein NPS29_00260 [Pseudomonas putida]|uniref:hypothetical protein n=1 Tax=Pseudomonas putida TaxID=303 RepID=UPI00236459D8|nr:hypothetical protein [Pseudomonas putida]MDD1963743.1 hypothetical protein [Pseudomonas putida]